MEMWRPVSGLEDAYEVSDMGRVRSLDRTALRADGKPLRVRGRVLTANPNSRGYARVTLQYNGAARSATVHSLVARAFLRKPPRSISSRREGFVVNHKDGDKLNNYADNLEYITSTANIYHARATGVLSVKGDRNNKAKLTDEQVREIRERYSRGEVQTSLARHYGVNQTTISRIVRREGWPHVA